MVSQSSERADQSSTPCRDPEGAVTIASPQATRAMPSRIIVELDVPITVRDGTPLSADVYRPADEGRYPVLLARTTYGKSTWGRWIDPERCAAEGWVVVVNDMRGHGVSAGELDPFRTDVEDGADVVAWCTSQPWSSGRVGMYGSSACGFTQLQAAVARPDGLVAIAPMQTWTTFSRGCAYDPGGAFSMYTQDWALMQTGADLAAEARQDGRQDPDRASFIQDLATARHAIGRWHSHLPVGELPPLPRDAAPWFHAWLEHPDDGAWWDDRDVSTRLSDITLPGLHLVGWFDRFCRSTVANYVALRRDGAGAPQKLVIGPWPHGVPVITTSGDRFFGPNAEVDARALVLRWYDHWLRGNDTGLLDEPAVRYYLLGADEWHTAEAWPLTDTRFTTFHLRSEGDARTRSGGGRLDQVAPAPDEPADRYRYDPMDPTPSVPGRVGRPFGSVDQGPIEDRDDVLVYSTPPLETPVDLVGPVRASIWAATDARDTDWVVKLVDAAPDGTVMRLAEGMIRARYRDSQRSPRPLTPDEVVRYDIEVGPVGCRFQPGHRIRVEIASASFAQFDRNMNTGAPFGVETAGRVAQQRVLHDAEHPSHVVLPVIPRG